MTITKEWLAAQLVELDNAFARTLAAVNAIEGARKAYQDMLLRLEQPDAPDTSQDV